MLTWQRRVHDKLLDDAGGDAADPVCLATVVAECKLVEVGLQVLIAHRARMRAEQPSLQQ